MKKCDKNHNGVSALLQHCIKKLPSLKSLLPVESGVCGHFDRCDILCEKCDFMTFL